MQQFEITIPSNYIERCPTTFSGLAAYFGNDPYTIELEVEAEVLPAEPDAGIPDDYFEVTDFDIVECRVGGKWALRRIKFLLGQTVEDFVAANCSPE